MEIGDLKGLILLLEIIEETDQSDFFPPRTRVGTLLFACKEKHENEGMILLESVQELDESGVLCTHIVFAIITTLERRQVYR
jgi:hypothetical protein